MRKDKKKLFITLLKGLLIFILTILILFLVFFIYYQSQVKDTKELIKIEENINL